MRVVAGTARGRRLTAPPGTATRPTTDRVREAMFNALTSLGAVDGATTLDAFAGSGALGIEALSRGAARVTFVERDRVARAVVEANLASTGMGDRAEVVAGDTIAHLVRTVATVDLALLDPPRDDVDWPALLAAVAPRMSPDAVAVIESDRPVVDADGSVADGWSVLREKRYGGTVVQMLRLSTPRGEA